MTDSQLFELCVEYGRAALEARRKFLGLLPEVARRELWRAKGFCSIFEFAARLAGVSEELVRRTLNLEERFVDKPLLRAALVDGKISINKLARVAAVATQENESFWAAQAEVLSKAALETLVRDEKMLQISVPGHTQVQLLKDSVKLAEDVETQLVDLQKKGIDIDELIREMLVRREVEITEQKEKLAGEVELKGREASRYIPVRIRRVLREEHGGKCSIRTCKKLAVTLHHTQRFSITKNHDPHFLAPLCKEHHEIAHNVDREYREMRFLSGDTHDF